MAAASPLATVCDFGCALSAAELGAGFIAAVGDQGLIAVTGEDAASFLHNQLTNDVEHLGLEEARLAGYCSPKGRLLATFLMWRNPDAILLQLPRDIQPSLQKRLQMFVLRAKASLSDATARPEVQVMLGLGGAAAPALLRDIFGDLPARPYATLAHANGTLIRLADAFGFPRFQWMCSQETAISHWPALAAKLAVGGDAAWALSGIHAGVAQVGSRTQEQFVPQMVNYELLGAVNFKKGCYPGQEIVARSQYLGKLKRRTALVRIDSDALAGQEVFAEDDADQPCGMVVNAAPNGLGGVDALVEMKLAALEKMQVHLASASGPALALLPMPYALDALEL